MDGQSLFEQEFRYVEYLKSQFDVGSFANIQHTVTPVPILLAL